MKKSNGVLSVSVDVECPYCDTVIDLFTVEEFRADGFIADEVIKASEWGCDDLDEECTCPECKKEFLVGKIEW